MLILLSLHSLFSLKYHVYFHNAKPDYLCGFVLYCFGVLVDGEDVEVETTGRLGAVRYPEVQSALSSIMHHRNPTLNDRVRDYGPDG